MYLLKKLIIIIFLKEWKCSTVDKIITDEHGNKNNFLNTDYYIKKPEIVVQVFNVTINKLLKKGSTPNL